MIFLSSKVSDGNMSVIENRKKFFKKLGINPKNIAEVKQIHSNKVVIADHLEGSLTEADGLIANRQNCILMVKVADCMAIAFYDHKQKTVGLAHAGFRGLKNGIIKNTVLAMIKHYKTKSKDLIVKISPSIGLCHYKMDLWQEAEKQLVKLGILKGNIDNPKICTYENKDYFSHRRSVDTKTTEGRFVTILGL